MPWDTIGYDKPKYSTLMEKYGIRGIPTLVLLGKDGETAVSTTARGDIGKGLAAMNDWMEAVEK